MTQDAYTSHLGKIVLLAARHGKVVFVGRGAQFFLPRDRGMSVRIIASETFRIYEMLRRSGLSYDQSKKLVEQTDRGRCEFVRRYFQHDVADPQLYDLIINVEKLSHEGAAALIVEAFRQWFSMRSKETLDGLPVKRAVPA